MFKVSKVERKAGMVLSYWSMPEAVSEMIDHVVVAKKENRLESVIIVGGDSRIISRQFYKDYYREDGFEFPQRIVQIIYGEDGKENYQVTEFSNIKVNSLENSELYQFKI